MEKQEPKEILKQVYNNRILEILENVGKNITDCENFSKINKAPLSAAFYQGHEKIKQECLRIMKQIEAGNFSLVETELIDLQGSASILCHSLEMWKDSIEHGK